MKIKNPLLFFTFIFHSLRAVAINDGPFSHCELTAKFAFALEPIRIALDKAELTNDVARFLNAFPLDFLIKNQNVCFVLVEGTQRVEAMTTKNVVKTDLWEDRSEMFSALYRNQLSSAGSSPLQKKAAELKRFLRNISPAMNDSFWSAQRDFSW